MTSKTPVSALQEMMTRIGSLPKYQLIYDGSGTHAAEFAYQVNARNISAIGTGRSKKEAKQEAARVVLEKMTGFEIEGPIPPGVFPLHVEITTPYKDKIKENAVGALTDMCCTNDLPIPEYRMINEEGPPHEKTFTIVCSVSKLEEIGMGRTKKQAKQLAAFNMMHTLQRSLGEILRESQDDELKPVDIERLDFNVAKYVNAVGAPRKKFRLNMSPGKYNFFSDISDENLNAAFNILSTLSIPENIMYVQEFNEDWMEKLDQVLNCLCVEKRIVLGKPSKRGDKNLFIQINLSSDAVFYGTGVDYEQALQQAACMGLYFHKVNLKHGKMKE